MRLSANLLITELHALGPNDPAPHGAVAVRGSLPGGELWIDGMLVGQVVDIDVRGETVEAVGGGLTEFIGDGAELRCVLFFNERVGIDVPTTETVCDECGGYPTHRGTCSQSAMRSGFAS